MNNLVTRLLFPPKCMLCGKPLPQKDEVCETCRNAVLLNDAPPRRQQGAFFDEAVAALWYEGNVRTAIHGLKYREKRAYALPLARVMAYALSHKLAEPFDCITFVPTNRATQYRRGYNQAEELARALAGLMEKPCLPMLKKVRETAPMHGLHPAERRANVLGAYTLCCPPEQAAGKRILLADDVLTTGSTLSECARMLKMAGAERVFCICAAAARKPAKNSENEGKYS